MGEAPVTLIFRKERIDLIKQGVKTRAGRCHCYKLKVENVYEVKESWLRSTGIKILITRVCSQRLGDIKPEEALKEGVYIFEEFKKIWKKINGSWNPDKVVTVYEFKLHKPREPDQSQLNGFSSKPRHRP